MYTRLEMNAKFKKEKFKDLAIIINKIQSDDNHWDGTTKEELILLFKDNEIILDFLKDYSYEIVINNILMHKEDTDTISIVNMCSIKDYYSTYLKFRDFINSLEPISGNWSELYEGFNTPDIYEVQNGKFVQIKESTYDY